MGKNITTTRITALSVLSSCRQRQNAAGRITCERIGGTIRRRLRVTSVALLLVAAPFAGAADFIQAYYSFPAAAAGALGSYEVPVEGGYQQISKQQDAYDLNLMTPLCGPNHVRRANVNIPSIGFAGAEAGKGYGHAAVAGAEDGGAANAAAGVWVQINDPQNRATVKLNLRIKGFASASEPVGVSSGGSYKLYVARALSGTPTATLLEDGCSVYSVAQSPSAALLRPLILYVGGYDIRGQDADGNVHEKSGIDVYRYDQLVERTSQSFQPMDTTIEVAPNQSIAVVVEAAASSGGAAAIDPIITAHPDNPDVEVQITGVPDEDTGEHLLDGFTTADSLAALGVDPQPFINLGFLSPAAEPPVPPNADTAPPTTNASVTPDANAVGWNRTPVTITLNASDNAGGSGVKELHYALNGAMTGSQIVAGASTTVTISAEGTTTAAYFAVDNAGNQEAAKTLTVRIDKTPPSLAGLPASGCSLWPPDHRLVQVGSISAADGGSGVGGFTLDATSNEPESGTGDGDIGPDVIVTGGVVELRAERAGNGFGRMYTMTVRATDQAGNVATRTATCAVPRDQGID